MHAPSRHILALCVALASGCATQQAIRPTSPFTAEQARYFDDSVDYISDLDNLGGTMADDLRRQLSYLGRNSDLIAIVRLETVAVSQDPDGTQSYRIVASIVETLHGTAPEQGRVQLRTSQGQMGYNTVAGRQERLQTGRWLVFVKWYTDATNEVRPHWHLYPHSDALVTRMREASGAPTDGFTRVVPSSGN
jgi:hypothetical protein